MGSGIEIFLIPGKLSKHQDLELISERRPQGKSKVHSFLGVIASLQHAPKKLPASKMEFSTGSQRNQTLKLSGHHSLFSAHVLFPQAF